MPPTPKPSTARPPTGAPAVKLLVTVASLASTVGGWALFTINAQRPVADAAPTAIPASSTTLNLAPLPTLIPAQVIAASTHEPMTVQNQTTLSVPQPHQPTLREVSPQQNVIAPAPVTITQSSR